MKLVRLEIQQLPGIERAFSIDDLAPGVNLVSGPNAIGKSSLIRALRYLVSEPAGDDPAALSLSADFDNGGRWSVTRTGRGYSWRHDGQPAERPSLPDRESLYCYWLTMENLVQAGDDDRQLVDQLRRALAGGYDLPALRGGDFEPKPRVGQNEGRELQNYDRRQRDVEANYRHLQQDEEQLPDLDERIEEARRAGNRKASLTRALELLNIIAERREIQETLKLFPENMAKLRGNELDRLQQLEQARDSLRSQGEDARRSWQDTEARLQKTGLAESRPDEQELEAARKRLEAVGHLKVELAEKREDRDKAHAEEASALEALGGNGDSPRLTPEQISRAERLASELKGRQSECREAEARLRNVGEAPDEREIHRHAEGVQALIRWLADSGSSGKGGIWGAILAAVGGVLVIVAALLISAWYALAAGIVVLIGAAWSLVQSGGRGGVANEARRDFEKQDLRVPATWDHEAVRQTLEHLQDQLDAMRLARQQALSAASDRERLESLNLEREALEREKDRLAEEIGFDPNLTAVGIDHFIRQVDAYYRAARERASVDATIRRLEHERDNELNVVRKFLGRWQIEADGNQADLESALSDLANRTRNAGKEEQQRERVANDLQRLEKDLGEREREIELVYREADLEAGDRNALGGGLEQLEQWREQRQRLSEIGVREAERRHALAEERDLTEAAENRDRETLERELEEARALADRYEGLVGERSDIKARLENAGGNRALERATAEVGRAREALEDRMNEQLFAAAGQFLLDEVSREHRIEHEPDVLRDARERFQRFTHHAWSLELVNDALMARDSKQGVLRDLEAMSSGTRMQLLLAVRLAWTRRLEQQREALPLFLDEALTTSDERRFAAVAESLETLAREEGRQVIYLSARRQELGLWEKVTGHRPHHIDLAQIRGAEPATTAEDYALPAEQSLPEPGGKSPEAWAAEVGVPPVRPMQPATELHLFHLLRDDLELLYRLMHDWNVATLGQLESLLESALSERAVADAETREKLRGRCRTAVVWMTAWCQGRGEPVDRIVLEQSGAVSDNYIESVTELAKNEGGNAKAIITALESKAISGFQARKIKKLKVYLEENGFISHEGPLDAKGREQQALLNTGLDAVPDEVRRVVRWLEAAAH